MKQSVIEVHAYAKGIKKRCRKPDSHIFTIAKDLPADAYSTTDMVAKAIETLRTEMKQVMGRAYVDFMPVELEHQGDMVIRTYKIGLGQGMSAQRIDLTEAFFPAVAS
jgi:hypothetical protein